VYKNYTIYFSVAFIAKHFKRLRLNPYRDLFHAVCGEIRKKGSKKELK
jgi:DNA-binding cell septation regulator SpoVG